MDGANVIKFAGSSCLRQGIQAHRYRDVGSLAAHLGPVGRVQPPATDLSQCIGTPLRGAPPIVGVGIAEIGVDLTLQSGENGLTYFRIQVAIDANHPEDRPGDMKVAPLVESILAIRPVLI
jgi:hypothetical protein